jgi:signal transduction histidine kinase/ActR/RegA family two-component response regulator
MTEGRFEAESWRVRKDGSLFWANVVIDPIRGDDGQVLGFSKLTRDITERREAQLAMQKTQTQLAQMQKMEALGQLTGGVAHDFNNLLMVVSGYIPLIKQRLANDPKGQHAADAIELAAQRGATLTRQLLSFSRRQSLNPTLVHLNKVLEGAHPMLTSLLGGAVRYVTTILPDVWPVRVDRSELELAIVNMCVNARDAMGHRGGTIALTAENTPLVHEDIVDELEGDFVALTVADTGQGMPPDILARVFDPFFTTKGEGKGTGLGLSQVHGFVHQSGGAVTVASEIGQGTRITLYLPRASGDMNADVAAETPDASASACNVLLVEDNPDVAEVTAELLARMGCETEKVGDAAAALKAVEGGAFDLMLSDIVMAGPMNGLDLARAVRKKHPDLLVVLATGYSEAAGQAAAEFTVLRKPYNVADLDQAIADARRRQAAGQRKVVDFQNSKRERAAKGK